MALGAQRGDVMRMIMSNGISLAMAGVMIGTVVALCSAPLLRSMLNGVSPRDPVTFIATSLILLTAASLASWIPAHRATRVDPNTALRCE
jgi:ABC-type lipoprotein release transport system permease subunit